MDKTSWTLRDEFAARTMQALLHLALTYNDDSDSPITERGKKRLNDLALASYWIADKMLVHREMNSDQKTT